MKHEENVAYLSTGVGGSGGGVVGDVGEGGVGSGGDGSVPTGDAASCSQNHKP